MAPTAGIRFKQAGKIFYYKAGDFELQTGAYVVVETAHGLTVGRVVITPEQFISTEGVNEIDLKLITRLATQEDVERAAAVDERAKEALLHAKAHANELGLEMSINGGEFDLDGTQFTAYFTAGDRVDFRGLVRDLSADLGAHVQLLQVGDRDRAKLVDGFDICGERLCCSSWMTNFPSVSIRMAKEQDLPLNPQKISGVCGRLYCCLTFEYEDYRALRGTLPKVGSFLSTPAGQAKVTGIDFNREVVKLWLTEQHEQVEVAAIDFQLQNGVAIRPMELVHKIEGPLRTVFEDGGQRAAPGRRTPGRTPAPPTRGGPRERPGRPETPQADAPRTEGAPAQPRPEAARPPRPEGARPPRPEAPGRGRRPRPGGAGAPSSELPAPPQPPANSLPVEGESGAAAARRRRRRRGRGRGGAEGGSEQTPDAGSE